ncbi:MAG: branched-chain amino acid transport system permease protein [Rhodospirillaceae bacterium]|jgi:branched-chain amino acid transport system permease protein|nr:branched-chain amino acid transport system permease protein [Rhodospirillaceae bacterium]
MDNIALLFQEPPLALQLLLDGVLIGSVFALAAYGMALVWGVMNIINVCQGEFVILGGYVALELARAGVQPLLGIPAAAAVLFLVGWLCYRLVIFRIVERDRFISLLATFGLGILLAQLMHQMFGANVESFDPGLGSWFLFEGVVSISVTKVVACLVSLAIAGLLVLFMRFARLGQAIRATAQNARAARILGVDTDRVYAVTYALNAAICGAAGGLVVMIWVIQPFAGLVYTVRAFMIVILAGLGNLPGVVLAALGLGAAEQFVGFVLGAQFQVSFVFLALVAILVLRSWRLHRQRRYLA